MNPKISIIVPIYKVPTIYLKKCIESLMNQTLKEIEILLIDDGSPDQCPEICDKYSKLDDRIKVIHKENGGLAAARNTGAMEARGEWITFVDGDDWLDETACEKALKSAEKNNVDIVCWGYAKDYKNKSENYNYSKYFIPNKLYQNEECMYFQEMALNFDSHISTAYAKLIKNAFIKENSIYHDGTLRQGWEGIEFCVRLFGYAKKIIFLEEWWYHYTYNPQSISNVRGEENNQYVLNCIKKVKHEIIKYPNYEELKKWLDNRIMYLIVATAISGYFSPNNGEKYSFRKQGFRKFLKNSLIEDALKNVDYNRLTKQRRIIIFLIKKRMYVLLEILGKLRKVQKTIYGAR